MSNLLRSASLTLRRYTKALDAIKVLRKDQAVEIRVNKEKLLALKTDRDRSIKVRSSTALPATVC